MKASRESLSSQCDEAALYSPDEAAALVARLCEALLGVSSYAHIINPNLEIPEASLPALQDALARLAAGEPLQYVLGYADFLGMRLRVTPDVLIPRPETEELCRRVIASYSSGSAAPRAILDLCCGSGCITWAMARAFPDALVVGVDLSAEALTVARSQDVVVGARSGASASRLSPPVFLQADVLQVPELLQTLKALLNEHGCAGFDLLLSNPPYVRESERTQMRRNVLDFEPEMALFVPDADPLRFYKASAEVFASELFAPSSFAAFELNEALGESTENIFKEKMCAVQLQKDIFEKNRFLFAKKMRKLFHSGTRLAIAIYRIVFS